MKKKYYSMKNFLILLAFAVVSTTFNIVFTAYTDDYVLAQTFVIIFQCSMLLSVAFLYHKSHLGLLTCFEFVAIHFINLIKSLVLLAVLFFNERRFLVCNVLAYYIIALVDITVLIVATIRFRNKTADGSLS